MKKHFPGSEIWIIIWHWTAFWLVLNDVHSEWLKLSQAMSKMLWIVQDAIFKLVEKYFDRKEKE